MKETEFGQLLNPSIQSMKSEHLPTGVEREESQLSSSTLPSESWK